MLRAYSTKDGTILWEFNTKQSFNTVNGVTAKGGGLGGPGVTVAGGMVFSNSGYGVINGTPGNVLLAFGVTSQNAERTRMTHRETALVLRGHARMPSGLARSVQKRLCGS
jgi:hypothetical protein